MVIADLTGYTAHISGSEIEHAAAIAGDLLETIVGRLEPPFQLAKCEGPKDGPLSASRRTMTAMLGGSASDLRRLRLKVGGVQPDASQADAVRALLVGWVALRAAPRPRAKLINQTLYERCRVGLVTLEWPRAQADGVFERMAERE